MLARRGATIIDADAIVRDLQRPGMPVLAAIVREFGDGVLAADGSLDRARLGAIVFADDAARERLNAIVHPAVAEEMGRRIEAARAADTDGGAGGGASHVVVLDVPLLVERPREGLSGVLVVDVAEDAAVARLVRDRGMSEADARARVAAQASREERRRIAGRVIDNSGDLAALEREVDAAWAWMRELPVAGPGAGRPARGAGG
ncbi:MAG: hypothetical protein RL283_827 [Actinomycetota bacterium]|jgi:dephospho-CoA kinase